VKDKILKTIPKLQMSWRVSLEIKPTKLVPWGIALFMYHHDHKYKTPGIYIVNQQMRVYHRLDNNEKYHKASSAPPINKWTSIEISQEAVGSEYIFSLRVNGSEVYSVENTAPREYRDVKVYTGKGKDIWPGFIRNLKIEMKEESLSPVNAVMSSTWLNAKATKCIDGKTDACSTKRKKAPWLALDFGTEVNIAKVTITTTSDGLDNAEVRVTNMLPTSENKMFTGGQLLGTFEGPASDGQIIQIDGSEVLKGKYLVIQESNGNGKGYLELSEVTAWVQGQGEACCVISA
jgi:hypothetical protein